jgi:hypothetical protein
LCFSYLFAASARFYVITTNIKQREGFDDFFDFTYPFHDQRAIALGVVVGRGWKWSIWRAAALCARTGRWTIAGEETSGPVNEKSGFG